MNEIRKSVDRWLLIDHEDNFSLSLFPLVFFDLFFVFQCTVSRYSEYTLMEVEVEVQLMVKQWSMHTFYSLPGIRSHKDILKQENESSFP